MYSDVSRIRKHVKKLRFSDEENNLVKALCEYTGEQPAVLIRELVLSQAVELLGITVDEAVERLAKSGLAARVRKKTRRGPAAHIRNIKL